MGHPLMWDAGENGFTDQLELFEQSEADERSDEKPGAVWNGSIFVSDDDLPENLR
jgi:hypothetical protein